DLVVEVLARPDRDPDELMIGDVMHADLVVAFEDDDVEHVIAKMREHAIRRVPIVDHEGGLQGLLTLDDVFGWMRDQIQTAARLRGRRGEMPEFPPRWCFAPPLEIWILRFCVCAPAFLGTTSVSTPSARSLRILSTSADSGSVNDRENVPYERSYVCMRPSSC